MATIVRHGGAAHVMRPDRVYRTSVLAPMVGYQPDMDVQAVAQEFTQGPPLGTDLSGLHGFGPLKRLGLKIKANLAARRARKFSAVAGLRGLGESPGPLATMVPSIAPQIANQLTMAGYLMQRVDPTATGPVGSAAYTLAVRRLNSLYRAG